MQCANIFRHYFGESSRESGLADRARTALEAATSGSADLGGEVAQPVLGESIGGDELVQVVLFWIDCLIQAASSAHARHAISVPESRLSQCGLGLSGEAGDLICHAFA